MKKLKYKWLALLITSLLFLSSCGQVSTDDFFQDIANTTVEKKATTEISNSLDKSNRSAFTGNNFSALPKNELMQVELKKHIDGDTSHFLLDGHKIKVRYLLIDTPETVHPTKDPEPFGHEASSRTKELLENASKIEIMLDKGDRTDHYRRLLAYVFVDGELVQDILIQEGLGRVAYITEPNTTYLSQLSTSEQQAQQNKIGIWSLDGYVTDRGYNP